MAAPLRTTCICTSININPHRMSNIKQIHPLIKWALDIYLGGKGNNIKAIMQSGSTSNIKSGWPTNQPATQATHSSNEKLEQLSGYSIADFCCNKENRCSIQPPHFTSPSLIHIIYVYVYVNYIMPGKWPHHYKIQ
jgi:hypothetical protein